MADIRAFRARYGLPLNDPKLIPYSAQDPGFTSGQIEANLDLEWSGAVAPKATIFYVYGPSILAALVSAVEANVAPVVSISAGGCEVNFSPVFYRSVMQQGNAQGITILAASGDSGAAACDLQGSQPFATRGRTVAVPAALPEVTAVGGTQFAESGGAFWSNSNSSTFGSALSYIPEQAWNESSPNSGLLAGGGGASSIYPRPAWQTGPGVPSDAARHIPDVSLSAALHDAYSINYQGLNIGIAGTSAAAPSMAGIVALLNQYQVVNGFQQHAGLGNINPQLYRLAQSAPAVFHDTTSGDNVVPCAQGSPDCLTGSFGYQAGAGYDMATGLGSVDANALAAQWNAATQAVTVTLSSSASSGTLNDTIQLTAAVAPASGGGTPTGTVNFVSNGIALGSAALENGMAAISIALYRVQMVAGTATIAAEYSGDAAFSSGGTSMQIRMTLPPAAAAVLLSAPNTVSAALDAQGPSWQTTLVLQEVGGAAPALITGFAIDGQPQSLPQYFRSPNIPAGGSVSASVVFRNLTVPLTRVFAVTGVDANGNAWSRQASVIYFPSVEPYGSSDFRLTATPLTIVQNTSADPSCQWAVQLNVDDIGGYGDSFLDSLVVGGVDQTSQIPSIFGARDLIAWGGLQGALCFGGIVPPALETIFLGKSDGTSRQLTVFLAGPPVHSRTISVSPFSIGIASPSAGQTAQATLTVTLSGSDQSWTASIFPANRTTSWLTASQLSGVGGGTITLNANPAGFEPGAYRATIVFQSPDAIPQVVSVPVMFVIGGSAATSISGAALYGSNVAMASPGTLFSVSGSNLANTATRVFATPLPYTLAGVSATVNGIAAPILSVSPDSVTVQIPYEAGAGPAVLSINNNGQIAGFSFQIAPSSPAILADASGHVAPFSTVNQGGSIALYVVGVGDVSPSLRTGLSPPSGTSIANLPKPLLPLSATVAGIPAFVEFAGVAPGVIGLAQVNIAWPASIPKGAQPVVVTVGEVSSAPDQVQDV